MRRREFSSLSKARLIFQAAASALNFSPLWNLILLRSWKRQAVGLVCSHFSASRPVSSIVLASRSVRRSRMFRVMGLVVELSWTGSISSGSAVNAMTIFPVALGLGVGLGSAAVGAAGATVGAAAVGGGGGWRPAPATPPGTPDR